MDIIFNIMDFSVKHLMPLPRRFNSRFPVRNIGYLKSKTNQVSVRFKSCNFSFILSGGGFYRKDGREWRVEAPCVLTQWAFEDQEYGPEQEWEELYFIYSASLMAQFENRGFLRRSEPIWQIRDISLLRRLFEELACILKDPAAELATDRIDLLCERIIMESHVGQSLRNFSDEENRILEIHNEMGRDLSTWPDFDQLVKKHSFSQATFRRHWLRYFDVPPAKELMRIKILEARRLLVESSLGIGEIAGKLGFEDPLYFSRKFRNETGTTATEYRKLNQNSLKTGLPNIE